MGRKFVYTFKGDCPYTGTQQSIRINYLEIPVLGTISNTTRKDIYHCPLSNECPYPEHDNHYLCPVYRQAPESIN